MSTLEQSTNAPQVGDGTGADVAAIRRDALRALGLVLAFPVLVVVLIIAIIAVEVAVIDFLHVTVLFLHIVSFFSVLALLRVLYGLLRPRRSPSPLGILVSADNQPDLVQLIEEVAAHVDTAPPNEIWLVPGTIAAVQEETLLLGLVVRRRRLLLGYGLLSLLSREELVAVLAHEHGHFAGGDTRLKGSYSTRTAMALAADDFGDGMLGQIFRAYERTHRRLSRRAGRLQEQRADGRAAGLTEPVALARALCVAAVAGPLLELFVEQHVARLLEQGRRPTDLYATFRAWTKLPEVRSMAREHLGLVLEEPEDPDSTHPTLSDRLVAAGFDGSTMGGGLLAPSPGPTALAVLHDEPATASRVSAQVKARTAEVTEGRWQSIAATALHEEWIDGARRILTAAAGGRSTLPVGRFLDLVGNEGAEPFAKTFVPDLDRRHEGDRRALLRDLEVESVLTVTVAALLENDALVVEADLSVPRGRFTAAGEPWSLSAEPSLAEGARAALAAGGVSPEWTMAPAADLDVTSRRLVRLFANVGVRRKRHDLVVLDDRLIAFRAPALDTAWHNLVVGYGDPGGFYRRRTAARLESLLEGGVNGLLTRPSAWTLPAGSTGVLQVKKQRWQIEIEAPDGQKVKIQGDPKAVTQDELRATFDQVLRSLTVR